MSSKFNQGKPPRKTPPVCFPPPPGPLPIPTLLPQTLHATMYRLYADDDDNVHLDILRTTLERPDDTPNWQAESGEPPDYYRIYFQYNQAGDFIACEYERATETVPDWTNNWELPRANTRFPTFIALPKDEATGPPTTTWGYITA